MVEVAVACSSMDVATDSQGPGADRMTNETVNGYLPGSDPDYVSIGRCSRDSAVTRPR